MNRGTRKLAKQTIAVTIVVALLGVAGVSIGVIFFLTGVSFVVFRLARKAERKETKRIFAFYMHADEVLRNDERHWYGFELHEIINEGERILSLMSDPPALSQFAVGALCHRVGDHEEAVALLTPVVEIDWLEERRNATPSPQLRRYVEMLREIEREPAIAPQALGAVRSLERLRQRQAQQFLLESKNQLATQRSATNGSSVENRPANAPLSSIMTPPPITEVLHNVYDEDTTH